jgi:prophage regulatory protein
MYYDFSKFIKQYRLIKKLQMERSMSMKILKLNDVKKLTTFSVSTIYRLASEGKFPKPIKLAERSSGWLEKEVLDYINNRINCRDDFNSQNGKK